MVIMENIKWVFDGIGTSLLIFILGLVVGGGITYNIAIRKKTIKQTQKAGDNSNPIQIGEIKNGR